MVSELSVSYKVCSTSRNHSGRRQVVTALSIPRSPPRSGALIAVVPTVVGLPSHPDEDIIGSDMTLLSTSKLKVKAFHVSFIFGRFYGLMLHLKVCTFSFSELLTWINGRFDCIVKTWKVNEVDWGPSASVPNILHQATSHF